MDSEGSNRGSRKFDLDKSLDWSDSGSSNYASQDMVYKMVGRDMTKNAFQGYKGWILAYLQMGKY